MTGTGTTDSNGTVVFTGVPSGSRAFIGNKSGFVQGNMTVNIQEDQSIILYLTPSPGGNAYTVTVQVRNKQTEAPIPGATVTFA